MKKIYDDSTVVVWGARYINMPGARDRFKNANIVQIQPGCAGEYMVEIREAKNEIHKSEK